jgi:hypothetical protein
MITARPSRTGNGERRSSARVFDISQFRSGAFIRRVLFVVEPGTPLKIFEPRTLCGLYSRAASWTFAPFVRMERIATTARFDFRINRHGKPPLCS